MKKKRKKKSGHQNERRKKAERVAVAERGSEKRATERGFAHNSHNAQEFSGATPKQAAMTMISFPKVVVPSLLGSFVISYAFWDLARNRKIFGGQTTHFLPPPSHPPRCDLHAGFPLLFLHSMFQTLICTNSLWLPMLHFKPQGCPEFRGCKITKTRAVIELGLALSW